MRGRIRGEIGIVEYWVAISLNPRVLDLIRMVGLGDAGVRNETIKMALVLHISNARVRLSTHAGSPHTRSHLLAMRRSIETMIESFQRIDDQTMSLVREFGQQYGCSDEVALKFLLKIGKYPQADDEDDEAYAARLDGLPDPDVFGYRGFEVANDL